MDAGEKTAREIRCQLDVTVVPGRVQFLGGTDNAMRHVQIGRAFNLEGSVPHLGAEVPSWLGETIGSWDGDTLITRTSKRPGLVHAQQLGVQQPDATDRDLEEYFEKDMERPAAADELGGFK